MVFLFFVSLWVQESKETLNATVGLNDMPTNSHNLSAWSNEHGFWNYFSAACCHRKNIVSDLVAFSLHFGPQLVLELHSEPVRIDRNESQMGVKPNMQTRK